MKPIVLIVKEVNGQITMDAEVFQRTIDQVYEIGRYDGASLKQPYTIQPTWDPFKNGRIEITCEDKNEQNS